MVKVKGNLKHGLKVGDELHKEFEMRAHLAGDMFDAELEVNPHRQPMTYNALLAGLKVVRLGTLEGALGLDELRKLHPEDIKILIDKSDEVQKQGK